MSIVERPLKVGQLAQQSPDGFGDRRLLLTDVLALTVQVGHRLVQLVQFLPQPLAVLLGRSLSEPTRAPPLGGHDGPSVSPCVGLLCS